MGLGTFMVGQLSLVCIGLGVTLTILLGYPPKMDTSMGNLNPLSMCRMYHCRSMKGRDSTHSRSVAISERIVECRPLRGSFDRLALLDV